MSTPVCIGVSLLDFRAYPNGVCIPELETRFSGKVNHQKYSRISPFPLPFIRTYILWWQFRLEMNFSSISFNRDEKWRNWWIIVCIIDLCRTSREKRWGLRKTHHGEKGIWSSRGRGVEVWVVFVEISRKNHRVVRWLKVVLWRTRNFLGWKFLC